MYFRAGVLEQLEESRGKFVRVKVVAVQRVLMGNAKRRPYLRLRNAAVIVQKMFRSVPGELCWAGGGGGCTNHRPPRTVNHQAPNQGTTSQARNKNHQPPTATMIREPRTKNRERPNRQPPTANHYQGNIQPPPCEPPTTNHQPRITPSTNHQLPANRQSRTTQ